MCHPFRIEFEHSTHILFCSSFVAHSEQEFATQEIGIDSVVVEGDGLRQHSDSPYPVALFQESLGLLDTVFCRWMIVLLFHFVLLSNCVSSLIWQEERIFGHHHDGLLLVVAQQLVADILLVDHQTEHILTEPAVGHDQTAILSPVGAP